MRRIESNRTEDDEVEVAVRVSVRARDMGDGVDSVVVLVGDESEEGERLR